MLRTVLAFLTVGLLLLPLTATSQQEFPLQIVLDDFERYEADALPLDWQTYIRRTDVRMVSPEMMSPDESFVIHEENGNRFVRATVDDQAHRILLTNGKQFDWNVRDHPVIGWSWRALDLPAGAREDQRHLNDTGAAVYVVFNSDWLGRPRSIKYTYSSTLSVGTTYKEGPLRGVVVASASDDGVGQWMTHERNVQEDYKRLFGRSAPERPIAIMLWSDSDTMDSTAKADFDNILLRARPTNH